jgi:hypothetical protein
MEERRESDLFNKILSEVDPNATKAQMSSSKPRQSDAEHGVINLTNFKKSGSSFPNNSTTINNHNNNFSESRRRIL